MVTDVYLHKDELMMNFQYLFIICFKRTCCNLGNQTGYEAKNKVIQDLQLPFSIQAQRC